MIEFVRTSLQALEAYGVLGLVFAVVLHGRGLPKFDPGAQGAGLGFRLLITPGVIALWPWLALRWWRMNRGDLSVEGLDASRAPRRLRAVHALAWKGLAVLIPLAVGTVLWWRPLDPSEGNLPESIAKAAQPGALPGASQVPQSFRPGTPNSH